MSPPEERRGPVTVLVIATDSDLREGLATALRDRGVAADAVASARAGERVLARGTVQLVILDLVLPDADGRSVIGELRKHPATRQIPIFVLAPAAGEHLHADCLALGAEEVFDKPVDPPGLAEAVRARLERPASQKPPERHDGAATVAETGSGTILVVEDDPVTATLLRHRLEREGLTVVHYPDGQEAFEAAGRIRPTLVLLDVKLPGMDGFELLQRLRARDDYRNVPIILLTSLGDEGHVVRSFELGADDYIVKPFSPNEVVARIRRRLARNRTAP